MKKRYSVRIIKMHSTACDGSEVFDLYQLGELTFDSKGNLIHIETFDNRSLLVRYDTFEELYRLKVKIDKAFELEVLDINNLRKELKKKK